MTDKPFAAPREEQEKALQHNTPPWKCFHCGEVFTTVGAAADHFGESEYSEPGCLIDRVALEEGGKPERGRGLLMALRKAEAEIETLRRDNEQLDHQAAHLASLECDYRRRWPQHDGNPVMAYDYLEGLMLVEKERADKAESVLALSTPSPVSPQEEKAEVTRVDDSQYPSNPVATAASNVLVPRKLLLTTLVDSEWQKALRWRELFLNDEGPGQLSALPKQLVAYLIADAETLRAVDAAAEAELAPRPSAAPVSEPPQQESSMFPSLFTAHPDGIYRPLSPEHFHAIAHAYVCQPAPDRVGELIPPNTGHFPSVPNGGDSGQPTPESLAVTIDRLRAIDAPWKHRPDPLAELDEIRSPSAAPVSLPPRDSNYYAQAVDLVCDELAKLTPEKLDERRDKMIAILRHAALAFNENAPRSAAPVSEEWRDYVQHKPECEVWLRETAVNDEGVEGLREGTCTCGLDTLLSVRERGE